MSFLFKLNTKQNNKRMNENENETVLSVAETQNRKQLPTKPMRARAT
jgi:hypothetical protein